MNLRWTADSPTTAERWLTAVRLLISSSFCNFCLYRNFRTCWPAGQRAQSRTPDQSTRIPLLAIEFGQVAMATPATYAPQDRASHRPAFHRTSPLELSVHIEGAMRWAGDHPFRAQPLVSKYSFLNFVQLSVERRCSCMRCPPLAGSSSPAG